MAAVFFLTFFLIASKHTLNFRFFFSRKNTVKRERYKEREEYSFIHSFIHPGKKRKEKKLKFYTSQLSIFRYILFITREYFHFFSGKEEEEFKKEKKI